MPQFGQVETRSQNEREFITAQHTHVSRFSGAAEVRHYLRRCVPRSLLSRRTGTQSACPAKGRTVPGRLRMKTAGCAPVLSWQNNREQSKGNSNSADQRLHFWANRKG
eukprot:2645459-Pleurochrysis_carterae.AAC.1